MGLTAIVKPTHECNLSCRYCYVDKHAETGRMDYKTLTLAMESVARVSDSDRKSIHFIWHGGEPLLMGLDFYQEVARISRCLRQKGYRVENGIQSNATLVTDEILDFIEKERDFRLGLSLDGPKQVNDQTRVYAGGKGAFDNIYRGVRLVRDRSEKSKKEIDFSLGGGVIVVLNKINIQHIDEVYDFFKSERIPIKINPLMDCGSAVGSGLQISPLEYAKVMTGLFDRWFADYDGMDIDPFSMIMGNLVSGKPIGCNYSVSCRDKFVSIGPQGDVYPCGRFDGTKNFWMGNIHDSSGLEGALKSDVQCKLSQRRTETIPGCSSCNHNKICNGGCMHNALLGGDVMGKDVYCPSYKLMFSHIEGVIKGELKKAELKGAERRGLVVL